MNFKMVHRFVNAKLTSILLIFRMKREVASSLVERGVAERVRLTQAYEKKKTELQKQHDIVKNQLNEHKDKVCFYNITI